MPWKPLPNGFSFLTEWFVLVPKNYDVFNIEMAKSSQTHFLLQNGIPDPIFFHRMEAYTRVNRTDSVEEMARGSFEVRSGLGLLKNLVFALDLTSPSNYGLERKKNRFLTKKIDFAHGEAHGVYIYIYIHINVIVCNCTWMYEVIEYCQCYSVITSYS